MASVFQLIAALVMAFFAARNGDCQMFQTRNATFERQPKEAVEVYKFTVPRQVFNEQRGSDRVRQPPSSNGQTYDIFIKPREASGQNVPGNQKITVIIEPNGNRQGFRNMTTHEPHRQSQQSHNPTPLSVKTVGPIIETFQQKKSEKSNFTDASDPFKKQGNVAPSRQVYEQNVKHVHTSPDVGGGRGGTQQQTGDKERRIGSGYVEATTARQELFHNQYGKGNDQRVQSEFNGYKAKTDGTLPRQPFEIQTSSKGIEKKLVLQDGYGIATQLSVVEDEEPRRPVQEQTYEGSWSSSRRPLSRDDFRDDRTESWAGTTPSRALRDSNLSQQSRRSTSDKRATVGDYSIISNGGDHRGRPEEKYPYNRDLEREGTDSRLPFQQVDDQRDRRTTTPRPTPTNAYFGFPESFTKNMQENSRISSSEINRPLPSSPCSSILKYTLHEEDRWFADIYVSTDEVLTGMRLDIDLSGIADLMTADTAEVKSLDNNRFTVLSLRRKLVPGSPEKVRIMVKYNQDDPPAPVVRAIRLNGRLTCPLRINTTPKPPSKWPVFPVDIEEQKITTSRSPGAFTRPAAGNEYLTTTRRTASKPNSNSKRTTVSSYVPSPNPDFFQESELSVPGRQTTKRPSAYRPGNDNARPSGNVGGNYGSNLTEPPGSEQKIIPCGTPAIQPRPLITNGQATTRGQWPWHVGLYKNIGPNLSYACGGSLVSEKHVITAAHCVTYEYTSTALDPKILLVYLGKYHLYVWTENGIINREVSRVNVHPNYNGTSFRADLAVLTLSNKVDYTDFIRPVCLWDGRNTRIEDIVGIDGTVVGWGFDERKELTEELRQAKMPVVSDNVCLRSYPEFYPKFTSNMTYCAGYKNGTSVCNGDSGGGMFFPIKVNREERWYLRGLVSLSPSEKDSRICDTKHYIIFTDVAKYLPWLADILF